MRTAPGSHVTWKLILGLVCLFLLLVPDGAVRAEERIESFHSRIQIESDATLTITETIAVKSEGYRIKRGIYRDFPTIYDRPDGTSVRINFKLLSVTRNGHPEPWHTENVINGIRIYIGDAKIFLPPGRYTYAITYQVDRELGFFADHDELYWNVTGNGWDFPMDKVSAEVGLPGGEFAGLEAYTGYFGDKGQDYVARLEADGRAVFETTRSLYPREGLTIVATWPKGVVSEPGGMAKAGYYLQDNAGRLIAWAGLVVLFSYFVLIWVKVGVDPPAGTIIPRFTPPRDFTPAAVRFVRRMSFDHKAFTAEIIDMAVRGYLTIAKTDKDYVLNRTGKPEEILPPTESILATKMFGAGSAPLIMKQENHKAISAVIRTLDNTLDRKFRKPYFNVNTGYFALGLLISLATIVGSCAAEVILATHDPFIIMMIIFTLIAVVNIYLSLLFWVRVFTDTDSLGRRIGRALVTTILALFFSGMGSMVIYGHNMHPPLALLIPMSGIALLNLIFHRLLKAPTTLGRKVLDEIEGFRLYLSVAEEPRLNVLNPPDVTPEVFERFLPYALALDVEQNWGEKFESAMRAAGQEPASYHPIWYAGHGFHSGGYSGFASDIGSSFTGAISSSSSAPGSGSGSGGGGSSGGGGGGGGGGGW